MIIEVIEKEAVYSLRHKILRPHRPYQEIQYETDLEKTSFHLGAYISSELVSVASFNKESFELIKSTKQYRLRAMATDIDYRKQGIGRALVDYASHILKEKDIEVLWCKGRVEVQAYYEKLGFKPIGEIFDYPHLGPHIHMYKKL